MGAAAQKQTVWTVDQVAGILRGMAEADVIRVLEVYRGPTKSTDGAGKSESAYYVLEDGVCDAAHFASIAANMVEDTLAYSQSEETGPDSFRFMLSKRQVETITWLSVQTEYATRRVREQFYAGVKGRAA